jgi:hypothetical protein
VLALDLFAAGVGLAPLALNSAELAAQHYHLLAEGENEVPQGTVASRHCAAGIDHFSLEGDTPCPQLEVGVEGDPPRNLLGRADQPPAEDDSHRPGHSVLKLDQVDCTLSEPSQPVCDLSGRV